eukprot:TRINITY_DN1959_c0_g6_i1.p1 TRINITY_DN1959_c0_g6~~TRINITY_DN1959_c0_g6_i1.p1  ORF type:complete len:572 (+),score=217.27 TRINITY_DN1959_c0_g6_i1:192-1907(+)
MELLLQYTSDEEDNNNVNNNNNKEVDIKPPPFKKIKIDPKPLVTKLEEDDSIYEKETSKSVYYNPQYKNLYMPLKGPTKPGSYNSFEMLDKNCWTGKIDEDNVSDIDFSSQFHKFEQYGYTNDPENNTIIGNKDNVMNELEIKKTKKKKRKRKKRKRNSDSVNDPSSEDYLGPWAEYDEVKILEQRYIKENQIEINEENENDNNEQNINNNNNNNNNNEQEEEEVSVVIESNLVEERSIFHGKEEKDYLGRTYMHCPSYIKPDVPNKCYIPKKRIHTWKGHTKGVNVIRLIPDTCHLLLSGGLDGKIKLWDVYTNRRVLRTFIGHDIGVKDLCFAPDGRTFLSASLDRSVKLWDAETGTCIQKFKNGKTPYCVKYYPEDPNEFLGGYSDKKIHQFDIRTGEGVQEYDRHLGAVNTITFIDKNRRFVTTSDDKSIRIWEYNIPVDALMISEPYMHSMPSVAVSPNGKWFACQSLDNQIIIYSAGDRVRLDSKKCFKGHLVDSFACQISFSPDGQYIISGDAEGRLFIWDWRTNRVFRKLHCHDQVTIGCLWHPYESSKVITCSWDGSIHYWD